MFFLIVPVPLQGTSVRTASKPDVGIRGKLLASCCVIAIDLNPNLERFVANIFILPLFGSFAIIAASSSANSAICVVFEPGAAQESKINSPGNGFINSGGIIETAS